MHYRTLRNKHQLNEVLPSFPRNRDEARACKIGRGGECEGMCEDISFEGASFPAESNFLAVAAASTATARNRVYEFQLQKTGPSPRTGR